MKQPGDLSEGPAMPNPLPMTDLTLAMVLWNEAKRLPAILEMAHRAFGHTVLVVQDSDDETWAIAQAGLRPGDKVIPDMWHGTGDASMPLLLKNIDTDWVFVLAGDEMPSEELLTSLWTAGWWAEREQIDGLWLPFHSTIDGVGYDEQHGHLRMFRSNLKWPNTMHSRPSPRSEAWWPYGYIDHDRSLDEMVQDYLRYLSMSGNDTGWINHNKTMLHNACEGVAAVKGWDFVQAFPWWSEVKAVAFDLG